jgi:hypothetical protein
MTGAMLARDKGGGATVASSANAIAEGVRRCAASRRDGSAIRFCASGIAAGSPACRATFGAVDRGMGSRLLDHARSVNGPVDEVRVCGEARSADWIAAEYASQRAWPASWSVGAEEAGGTPARGQAIIW